MHYVKYQKWWDTKHFQQAGKSWLENDYYCPFPSTSKAYDEYWEEQTHIIKNGMVHEGQRITGLHYLYLNYCPIKVKKVRKLTLPDFWSVDADYFEHLEYCLGYTPGMTQEEIWARPVVFSASKTRQSGASLKGMVPVLYNMNFVPFSANYIGAYLDKDAVKSMRMYLNYQNHAYKYTDWGKRYIKKDADKYYKIGYYETVDKEKIEAGYQSELSIVSFQDNPEKGVGGSCLAEGTEVRMFDGSLKPVDDLSVGDKVMGIDSKPRIIKRLFEGEKAIYRVDQKRGQSYDVTEDHDLYLYSRNKHKFELVKPIDFVKQSKYKREKDWSGVRTLVSFPNVPVDIDPYILGVWLGDGCKGTSSILVNKTKDVEIYNSIHEHALENNWTVTENQRDEDRYNDEMVDLNTVNTGRWSDTLTKRLKRYGVYNSKFVPDEYIYNSRHVRLEVLAGLIDTDGYYCKEKHRFEISTSNTILKDNIVEIGNSLGFYVNARETQNSSSQIVKQTTYGWVITIIGNDLHEIGTRVRRKQPAYREMNNNRFLTGIEVKYKGIGKYYGFELEGERLEDHLFFLKDYTITKNCDLFIIEEAGMHKSLLQSITFITPACKDGDYTTGNILVYGAAGKEGQCDDLKKLHYNPNSYQAMSFVNEWDPKPLRDECGYFIPNYACRGGHIDKDGNPNCETAIAARDKSLAELKKTDLEKYLETLSQNPNDGTEMFGARGRKRYDSHIIEQQITILTRAGIVGTAVDMYEDINTSQIRYKLSSREPIRMWPTPAGTDTNGAIEIFEFPAIDPPSGLYISAIDSYNQDDSTTTSLGCIKIYKRINNLSSEGTNRVLVAEYLARPTGPFGKHDFYRNCVRLLKFYNAIALPENEDHELTPWFYTNNVDHLLADQPDIIRSIIPGSNVKRLKGIHAEQHLIIAAENKIQRYLYEPIGKTYDEEGNITGEKLGVSRIMSLGLLYELLNYTTEGNKNFDRVRTFGWLLLYEEETINNPVEEKIPDEHADFLVNTKRFYKKQSSLGYAMA